MVNIAVNILLKGVLFVILSIVILFALAEVFVNLR